MAVTGNQTQDTWLDVASALDLLLSYDNQTTTKPHNPLLPCLVYSEIVSVLSDHDTSWTVLETL